MFISPNVEDSILPSLSMHLTGNARNSFQVSSAKFFPESVKKYAPEIISVETID